MLFPERHCFVMYREVAYADVYFEYKTSLTRCRKLRYGQSLKLYVRIFVLLIVCIKQIVDNWRVLNTLYIDFIIFKVKET